MTVVDAVLKSSTQRILRRCAWSKCWKDERSERTRFWTYMYLHVHL